MLGDGRNAIFNNLGLKHALLSVTLVEGEVCAGNPLRVSDGAIQKRKTWVQRGVVAHAFNGSVWEAEAHWSLELEARTATGIIQ